MIKSLKINENCSIVDNSFGNKFGFAFVDSETIHYNFVLDSEQEKIEWMLAIGVVIQLHQQPLKNSNVTIQAENLVAHMIYLRTKFTDNSNKFLISKLAQSLVEILLVFTIRKDRSKKINLAASQFAIHLKSISNQLDEEFIQNIVFSIKSLLDYIEQENLNQIVLKSSTVSNLNLNDTNDVELNKINDQSKQIQTEALSKNLSDNFIQLQSKFQLKESEDAETIQEAILRNVQEIKFLFIKSVEYLNDVNCESKIKQIKSKSMFTFENLKENFANLIGNLKSKKTKEQFEKMPTIYFNLWKEAFKIVKEASIQAESKRLSFLKENLSNKGDRMSRASRDLSSAAFDIAQQIYADKELNHSIELFNNPLVSNVAAFSIQFSSSKNSTLISKIVSSAKAIVDIGNLLFSESLSSQAVQNYLDNLERVYKTFDKIIEDCSIGAIPLSNLPKNIFIEVTSTIRDFAKNLAFLIFDSKNSVATSKLNFSASTKILHAQLQKLLEISTNNPENNETSSVLVNEREDINKSKFTHLNQYIPENQTSQQKIQSDSSKNLETLNNLKTSNMQNNSSTLNLSVRSKWVKITPKALSSSNLLVVPVNKSTSPNKSTNIWLEPLEGNIKYLSSYSIKSNENKILSKSSIKISKPGSKILNNTPPSSRITHKNQTLRKLEPNNSIIAAATLNKLVAKLTDESSVDFEFLKSFLATYRSFTTPEELWIKLQERYDVPLWLPTSDLSKDAYKQFVIVPIRLRVANVIGQWISSYWSDINFELLDHIHDFIEEKLVKDGFNGLYKKLTTIFEKVLNDKKSFENNDNKFPLKNRIETPRVSLMNELKFEPIIQIFLDDSIDAKIIAEQLTVLEWKYYSKIAHVELLNKSWSKENFNLSPNVRKMIHRFNNCSLWAASNILWQENIKNRVKVYTKIIHVAQNLFNLNNFNTALSIISGLNNSSVHRLKHTQDEVLKKDKNILTLLMFNLNSSGSYKEYRMILKSANPPIIPYLGVYLTDLTFTEDGNPDMIDGLINFNKRRLIYRVLSEIEQYQLTPYKIEIQKRILNHLSNLNFCNDEELYNLSLLREPRNSERADIR